MSTQQSSIFDESVAGSTKAAMKVAGASSSDLWMVPYEELHIADGFNVRLNGPDHQKQVEWLAERMVAQGYDRTKPMAGYVVKEGDANVIYITDGHTRHAAVALAREKGANIESIPVVVAPAGTSAEDLTAALVTANSGRPLSPMEVATVCKRLQGYGMDEKTIAARLSYTVPYVKQLLGLLAAPKAVREMVTAGKVSATLATQALKKHGKDAAVKLKEGLKKAEDSGKKKVTLKHVSATPAVRTNNHIGLIRELLEYVKQVRVGDDAQELVDRADAVLEAEEL